MAVLTEKTLEVQPIYQGRIIEVHKDRVELADGKLTHREVVEHHGGAGIVAITPQKEVILVRQYRYPVKQELWEIPAGKIDGQEDPLQTAQRELTEETGYKAGNWRLLSAFYSSPGFCNEKLSVYLAEDLVPGEACPDEGEFLRVQKFALSEALTMIQEGQIQDAKSIVGILAAVQFYLA